MSDRSTPTAEELIAQADAAWQAQPIGHRRSNDRFEEEWLAQHLADARAEIERLRSELADRNSRLAEAFPTIAGQTLDKIELHQRAEKAEAEIKRLRGEWEALNLENYSLRQTNGELRHLLGLDDAKEK